MAKKPLKEAPHLRVRIDPKLLAKLEKSREKNGRTLTGEIVDRLEQSFQADERMAIFKEAMEARFEDNRRQMREEVARFQKVTKEEALADYEQARQNIINETERLNAEFERKVAELTKPAAVVDVLLGPGKRKVEFFRSLALELARLPEEWLAEESNRGQLVERVMTGLGWQVGATGR
jgi:hypothetical protein